MSTEGNTTAEPGELSALSQLAHVSESVAAADTNYVTIEDRAKANSAASPTAVDPKKRKRKLGRSPKSKKKNAKKIHNKRLFINLTDVPPQPLILKNELSRTDYKDNFRRRPVKEGSSKYTGVYFDQGTNKWRAQIMVGGSVRSIGYYQKEKEAAAEYARAAFKYKAKESHRLYGGLDLSSVPEQPLIRNETSASGYKGVKKMKGRWQARISTGKGKHTTLGTFDAVEEAAGIYARAVYYLEQKGGSKCPTAAAGSNCNPIKMAASDEDDELVAV